MPDPREESNPTNRLPIELLMGFILAYFIIRTFFAGDFAFEKLALGDETSSYQAVDEEKHLIHIQRLSEEEKTELVNSWKRRGEKNVIFFLGNSQTHSINQQRESDVNYIELLYRREQSASQEVLCMSLPNAGLQEFFLAFEYWKDRLPIKTLIVPLFMDDMREDGIRDVFFSDLVDNRFQLQDTSSEISLNINRELRDYWSSNSNNQTTLGDPNLAALRETYQERTEIYLNNRLDSLSLAWNNRQNVRGQFFNWLYRLRNTVLRIKANTVRKMIRARYNLNLDALEKLISSALSNETQVLLYIPPIRSDVSLPYDEKEYEDFKQAVQSIAMQHPDSVYYKNYESIVSGKYWGYKDATDLSGQREVDYMHFQFEGHRLLADSLHNALMRIQGN